MIISQITFLDTLCAGQPLYGDPETEVNCSGTVTETSADLTCTFTEEISPGCTATITAEIQFSRTGDSFSGVQTITTTFSQGCEGQFPDTCFELTISGTRIAGDPDCPGVPVKPESWSSIKALYR
jgi:hypothetical protein